eukprot:4604561-Amphidinium_carterae.1
MKTWNIQAATIMHHARHMTSLHERERRSGSPRTSKQLVALHSMRNFCRKQEVDITPQQPLPYWTPIGLSCNLGRAIAST